MNESCLKIIKAVLQRAIEKAINTAAVKNDQGLFSAFGRVLVQDSTIIKLPSWLFEESSGVSNAHSKVCNARIQAVYDLKSMTFVAFSIDPYSKNDLSEVPELELREDDLVLRDRGYLTMDEIKRHIKVGADYIYRHKTKTTYHEVETGEPLFSEGPETAVGVERRAGKRGLFILIDVFQKFTELPFQQPSV